MSLLNALGGAPERYTCSRARCTARARTTILWRNPAIHSEDRTKAWLACDEHLEYLDGFLRSRGFPVRHERIPDGVRAGDDGATTTEEESR
ncbi:hypothetical protein [Mycetocola reblochoni]|uniref:Acetone carboxylase n=1 Tax=Mycetocola reblochoni REB411 TaxID=1255698 RepID=A0A1R4J5S2_9MICO|nr:hypothetical protein [Mycetocola reblochoni]SJN27274.1 hypothetical protein FM119_05525 [Mycetocola reblochoni REB411]